MNWFCIILIIIFFACILAGWIQGLFKLIISVAGLVASIMIAVYVAPNVCGYLEEHTQIDEDIAAYISEELGFFEEGQETSKGVQVEVISELSLPETLKTNILNNNNSEMYRALDTKGVYDYIAKSIALVILNALVFLVLMIVCRVFLFSLGKAMEEFVKLPIIRSIDKIGGGLLGLIRGLITLWIIFLVLSITSTFAFSQELIIEINQFPLFKLLYDNNILLDIVADLTKILFL